MKQHITEEQLNELAKEQTENLIKYLFPGDYFGNPMERLVDVPNIMSIGRMIEFLDEKATMFWSIKHQEFTEKDEQIGWSVEDYNTFGSYVDNQELCDALWEAVKEVLKSTQ